MAVVAPLPPLKKACVPRPEVLSGQIRDELFMASLSDVRRGKAHPIYQDPKLFFANTYPTERAISLLREVMGRLAGADPMASSLFRLDTPFGGGKTHTLIALYHLATWRPVAPEVLGRLQLDPSLVPPEPLQVVGVTCDQDLDPANGVEKGGVRIHHLWGEIAFQLGGPEGYQMVEESDRRGQAPGPHFLERLIGDRPVLLLIDEPAPYMRAMGPAAGQLPVFLKVLADWIASSPRAVLVLTLAWDPERRTATGDAFAAENQELAEALERAFRETQSVVSRPAKVVTPAQATDIAPILRQRLFQQVDESAEAAVTEAYFDALRRARDRGYPLPAAVVQASYRERLRSSYPFHPSLIEVLDGKLATIPNFQRTRGALRLSPRPSAACGLARPTTTFSSTPSRWTWRTRTSWTS
jgi:predicted AAA+ superfamily ATPase